ncbi:hypothetical protein HNP02_003171 [Mycobacterium sp. AZCC_0083]|nr:hypothetical protein [Mycobacterium sp. AZCC_0083]
MSTSSTARSVRGPAEAAAALPAAGRAPGRSDFHWRAGQLTQSSVAELKRIEAGESDELADCLGTRMTPVRNMNDKFQWHPLLH